MRILERLEQLATIGDRIGYSAEEDAAHELATGWFHQAGLEVEVDAAGNLVGRIPGGDRRGVDGLASRHRSRRRQVRRNARCRRRARSGRGARPAGARRRRLPRRGAGLRRQPRLYRPARCLRRAPHRAGADACWLPTRRSASSLRSSATSAAAALSPARPAMRARLRWACGRTLWCRRPSSFSTPGMSPAGSRARSRPSAR